MSLSSCTLVGTCAVVGGDVTYVYNPFKLDSLEETKSHGRSKTVFSSQNYK